jgi:hypothetical protein
MLTDDEDRRLLLVELREPPGALPFTVHRQFLELFYDVFGGDNVPDPEPVGLR